MTNTSGARSAQEAIRIARLAKASGCGNWIKIEVINDSKYLMPDNAETIKATEVLASDSYQSRLGPLKRGGGRLWPD